MFDQLIGVLVFTNFMSTPPFKMEYRQKYFTHNSHYTSLLMLKKKFSSLIFIMKIILNFCNLVGLGMKRGSLMQSYSNSSNVPETH